MTEELDAALRAVGPRLRELRKHRKLTLAALSEMTDIPISVLSRLESCHRKPSLELLLPLAKLYEVPLDELVGAPVTGDPRVYPRPRRRHGMTIIPLSHQAAGGLQAFKQILPAGPGDLEPDPRSHEGYHWLYQGDRK